MTSQEQKDLDNLIKAALVLFVMVGEKNYLTVQTQADNPEIGADEVVELTITRTKIIPPWRPLPPAEHEAEMKPITRPFIVDNTPSILYELFSLTIPPAETISINLEYRAMDLCTSDVSSDFTVDAMFSVDRGIVRITNNTEEDRTLENFKVYGRRIYMDAVTAYEVEGVAV